MRHSPPENTGNIGKFRKTGVSTVLTLASLIGCDARQVMQGDPLEQNPSLQKEAEATTMDALADTIMHNPTFLARYPEDIISKIREHPGFFARYPELLKQHPEWENILP